MKKKFLQINGCAFHAHPGCTQTGKPWQEVQHTPHPVVKGLTYNQLYERDEERVRELLEHEFHQVHVVRLCQFEKQFWLPESPQKQVWEDWTQERPDLNLDFKKTFSEEEVLEEIAQGRIKGFLICDILVDGELRKRTENFPIIFRHATVQRKHLGQWMQEKLESRGQMKRPVRQLISVHKAKQHVISTLFAQFYIRMGAKLSNVTKIFQYLFTDALTDFVNKASELRFASKTLDEKILSGLQKSMVVSTWV